MTKTKKILTTAIAAMMTFSTLAACGGTGSGNGNGNGNGGGHNLDLTNATKLKVGVFNGGLGYAWADKLEEEFEVMFKDVVFETGKKGVDVVINPQKDMFSVTLMRAAILNNNSPEDVYFTCYNVYKQYANEGVALNMTDVVEQKVYTDDGQLASGHIDEATGKWVFDGATKSLKDKMGTFYSDAYYMNDEQLDYNGDGAADIEKGYYALPYETSMAGIVYDHDLFEENEWLHYSGEDGVPGTIDEFFSLIEEIKQADMIPLIPGASNYWYGFRDAFMAQYEGLEAAELNYTYDGEYTFDAESAAMIKEDYPDIESRKWITVNSDGTYTAKITAENAWILVYQKGKRLYSEFCRDLATPGNYDPKIHQTSMNYEKVQQTFVQSYLHQQNQKDIAMLFEGEWWENEAQSWFTAGTYGLRDFRFMPLPLIDGQKTEGRSMGISTAGTDLFINAKTTKKELAGLWVQFVHSEHALEVFTQSNGAYRNAYNYDLSAEQLQKLTPFGRNVYDIKTNQTDDITVYSSASYNNGHKFFDACAMGGFGSNLCSMMCVNYASDAWTQDRYYTGGGCAWGYMLKNAGDVEGVAWQSAADYIEGMYDFFTEANWQGSYNTWLGN